MAYNDDEYVDAATNLDEAVWTLLENEISEDEIVSMVRAAVANA